MILNILIIYIITQLQVTKSAFHSCNSSNKCNSQIICNDQDCTLRCVSTGATVCEGNLAYHCTEPNKMCKIECIGTDACHGIDVQSNSNTTVICDGNGACTDGTFEIDGTNNAVDVNMTCVGARETCKNNVVNLYGSSSNNQFNLFCGAGAQSNDWTCSWMDVHCYFQNAQCGVECETNDEYSCAPKTSRPNNLHCHTNGIDTTCNIINTFPPTHIGFDYAFTFTPSQSPTTGTPTQPPTTAPSLSPTSPPSNIPSIAPSQIPSQYPSISPSQIPSIFPSISPSVAPTIFPSISPSLVPTQPPTTAPSLAPSVIPSVAPSITPSIPPTQVPSLTPSVIPSVAPTQPPSILPSLVPSVAASLAPIVSPTFTPSITPSQPPSFNPTTSPTISPTTTPSSQPTLYLRSNDIASNYAMHSYYNFSLNNDKVFTFPAAIGKCMKQYPDDSYIEYECIDNETAVYNIYSDNKCSTEIHLNDTLLNLVVDVEFKCDGTEDTFMELELFPNINCAQHEKITIFAADNVCSPYESSSQSIYYQLYCHDYDFNDKSYMYFYYFNHNGCVYNDKGQTLIEYNECGQHTDDIMPFYVKIIQCFTSDIIIPTSSTTIMTTSPSQFPSVFPTTIMTTIDDDDKDIGSDSNPFNSYNLSGYIVVISCICLPFIICLIIYLYHRKLIKQGTDAPAYVSVFKYFFGVMDFYTDAIWSLTLFMENNTLFPYSVIFVFGPHVVSICVCLAYVTKWKQTRGNPHIIHYATTYDKLIILLSLIGGFYTTTEIITSHIFHLNILSLQISNKTKTLICTNLKIANLILFENIPCLIIQYLYLKQNETSNTELFSNGVSITLLAMILGIFAILFSLLTITQRLLNSCIDIARNKYEHGNEQYEIKLAFTLINNRSQQSTQSVLKSVTSDNSENQRKLGESITNSDSKQLEIGANTSTQAIVQRFHIHSKGLLSDAMVDAFDLELSQIVSIYIKWSLNRLKVNAKIKYLNEDTYNKIQKEMTKHYHDLKKQIAKKLALNINGFDLIFEPVSEPKIELVNVDSV
eukprot:178622_1